MTVAHFTRGGSLPLSPRKRDSLNADTSRGQSVIETKSERSRYESPSVRLAAERLRAAPLAEPESEEILERSEQMTRGDPKSEHYRAVREVFTSRERVRAADTQKEGLEKRNADLLARLAEAEGENNRLRSKCGEPEHGNIQRSASGNLSSPVRTWHDIQPLPLHPSLHSAASSSASRSQASQPQSSTSRTRMFASDADSAHPLTSSSCSTSPFGAPVIPKPLAHGGTKKYSFGGRFQPEQSEMSSSPLQSSPYSLPKKLPYNSGESNSMMGRSPMVRNLLQEAEDGDGCQQVFAMQERVPVMHDSLDGDSTGRSRRMQQVFSLDGEEDTPAGSCQEEISDDALSDVFEHGFDVIDEAMKTRYIDDDFPEIGEQAAPRPVSSVFLSNTTSVLGFGASSALAKRVDKDRMLVPADDQEAYVKRLEDLKAQRREERLRSQRLKDLGQTVAEAESMSVLDALIDEDDGIESGGNTPQNGGGDGSSVLKTVVGALFWNKLRG